MGHSSGNRHQRVRARREIADGSVRDVKLRAIAIVQRRAADGVDVSRVFDLADAAQLFAQDLHFARELKRVRSVLVVAASAAREQRAGRRDAIGRRGQHFDQARRGCRRRTSRRTVSPGSTKGASTTRPSRRASASPPYTHFSMVTEFGVTEFATGADTSFTIEVLPIRHESKSPLRHPAHRQPAHRKLSWRAEELGQDPV